MFKLKLLVVKESDHQKMVIQWANHFWWAPLLIHIPNEAPLSYMVGAQHGYLKKRYQMGLKKGVPDLFLMLPAGGFAGLWLELKRQGQKPTLLQNNFLTLASQLGFKAAWSDNFDHSIHIIQSYTDLTQVRGGKYPCPDCKNMPYSEKKCSRCNGTRQLITIHTPAESALRND